MDEMLTVEQVGDILGVKKWSVYKLIKLGHLPSGKVLGNRRVRRSDLDTYMQDVVLQPDKFETKKESAK